MSSTGNIFEAAATAKTGSISDSSNAPGNQDQPSNNIFEAAANGKKIPVSPTAPSTPFQSVVKTLSPQIGGGALNVIPGQPNTIVNTGHTDYAGVPGVKGQERDDIVPVSLGGSNQTKANLRYEPLLPASQQKPGVLTASDAYLEDQLKLYKGGQQSLGQTRLNVLTFKQKQEGLSPKDSATAQPGGTGKIGQAIDATFKILNTNPFTAIFGPNKATQKQVFPIGAGLDTKTVLPPHFGVTKVTSDIFNALTPEEQKNVTTSANPADWQIAPSAYAREAVQNQEQNQKVENAQPFNIEQHPLLQMTAPAALFAIPEIAEAPIAGAAKLAIFSGLQAIESKLNLKISNLVPDSASTNAKDAADIVQMLGNGLASHGIYENAPAVADAFTKNIIETYHLPKQVTIPKEVIQDIFKTNTLATPEQLQQFMKLTGGDSVKIKAAINNGLDVTVPTEKITTLVDKPYWGKIKAALNLDPTFQQWKETIGEPTQAPAGLLPAPEATTPFQKLHTAVNPTNDESALPSQMHGFTLDKEPSTPFEALVAHQTQTATATLPPTGEIPAETVPAEGVTAKDGQVTALTTPEAVKSETALPEQALATEAKTFPTAQAFVDAKVPPHLKDTAPELYTAATEKFNKIYEETTKPKEEPPKPAEIKMARSQMPVGEGKERVSRLEARMKDALGQIDDEAKDKLGLQTYNQMNKADNIKAAAEYVTKNPDEAIKVLTGEIDAPPGILRNSVYVALQNAGADNADLGRKVASIGATRLGQELSILTEIDKNSPVSLMSDVVKFREAKFKEKADQAAKKTSSRAKSPTQAKKETVNEIKEEIKRTAPKKQDWASFIEEIKCK